MNIERIPAELCRRAQWVGCRLQPSDKNPHKLDKLPINPHTGRLASISDPATWGTYDEAVAAMTRRNLDGIMFALTEDAGIVFSDWDGCLDATGNVAPWAEEDIALWDSYLERSISGTGLHGLAFGKLPPEGRKRGPFEMYSGGRFAFITGDTQQGRDTIRPLDAVITALHAKHLAPVNKPHANGAGPHAAAVSPPMTDDEIIARASDANNGPGFRMLFENGDTSLYASPSEADLALANMLAFWTQDYGQIVRLMQRGALWDEKWERDDYQRRTIGKALAGVAAHYNPGADDDAAGLPEDTEEPEPPAAEAAEPAQTLADLRALVGPLLNRRATRKRRETVGQLIAGHFLRRNHLLYDDVFETPYLVTDTDAVLPVDTKSLKLAAALAGVGLNWSEQTYKWVAAELQTSAVNAGRHVQLARWCLWRDGILYLSCGPDRIVTVTNTLKVQPNGIDDVLFAADACLAPWQPAAAVNPFTLGAWDNANLEAPPEAPEYDDVAQRALLGTYMAALLAMRPLPLLGVIGNHGSGKSTLARAIGKAIIGPRADLTAPGGSERDIKALITSEGFAVLDNLDEQPDRYIPDVLAAAATGAWVVQRLMYTNLQLVRRPPTAAVAVTSRTGILFQRPDLRDRCLPLFCGELDAHNRRGEAQIIGEVEAQRDGILTWLARAAGRMMRQLDGAPHGLPGSQHYPDFNRLVWLFLQDSGEQDDAEKVLKAWRTAQELAITDLPPLADAIIQYLEDHEVLYGRAAEIVATLEGAGYDIPFMGGGKVIARMLRELKPSLRLAGIDMTDETVAERTTFRLYKKG